MIKEYIKAFLNSIKGMGLFLVFFFAYIIICRILDVNICFYKNLFGIPCPGCGFTRAWMSFFSLDIKEAFHYHPLFFLFPIVMMVYLFRTISFWKKIYDSKLFWIFIIVSVIICYFLRMFFVYPNVPMDPCEGKLFFNRS